MTNTNKPFEIISTNPTVAIWHGIRIIKVSDIDAKFGEWLHGQTRPLVKEDESPTDWAYYHDYTRWSQNLPIID